MTDTARRLGWKDWLVLIALSALVLLPGISSIPPVDRDESRYAVATSQMLASGDFIDIRFQDEQRYLQPAGIYWLQSISVALTGTADDRAIWAHRIPSFLGILAAVLMTGWIAAGLYGRMAGFGAALLVATCFAGGFEARIAKTDAMLLATITASHLALMQIYLKPQGHWWRPALFWSALGAGMMIKGPIILIFVLLALLALVVWDRKFAWLGALKPLWGVPLFLAIALPWYVAIGLVSEGGFYAEAIGDSLMGKVGESQQSHAGPPGYYLGLFSLTFWPGSLFFVFAGYWAWANRRDAATRYLIAWIVPAWIVYELIATKLPHYVMPVYPAMACLAVAAIFMPGEAKAPLWVKIGAGVYAALWLAASGLVAALGPAGLHWAEGHLSPLLVLAGVVIFLAAAAALLLHVIGRRPMALVAGLVAGGLAVTTVYGATLPRLDTLWLTPRIVAAVDAHGGCETTRLITSAFREPSLVYRHGPYDTLLAADPADAAVQFATETECSLALIDASEADAFLARAAALALNLDAVALIEGQNYSNGDAMSLTLYRAAMHATDAADGQP
ncbi:ArnT family glycosyltransferase [Maricaulis maris]|uniref:4-amino-4-deoxy-L-arabinose transferase-like glycosyltransferase n=1 Tax=Maricaulis maris TaxID=74318 RepID=A0A495CW19_9PROT|nr:glycosyltransferase family 39 protein [Maricaulis maris]RKQ89566.1 4-amino-4-deoxy-L-arabinose transferase-like glycosyltransferase [Maricaulis maris]